MCKAMHRVGRKLVPLHDALATTTIIVQGIEIPLCERHAKRALQIEANK